MYSTLKDLILSLSVVVLVTVTFTCSGTSASRTPSGLYHDDGHGHTILTQKFSKKDVREISHDILSIMGLHHRPHPNLVDARSPGSQFLWEVYNSISRADSDRGVDLRNWRDRPTTTSSSESEEDSGENSGLRPAKNLTWSQFNINQAEIDAITQADSIISFTNRGHRYSRTLLRGYEEEKQFWFDVSEVSDLESFVLGAELRIWKRTLMNPRKKAAVSSAEEPDLEAGQILRIAVKQIVPDELQESFEEVELDEIVVAKWEQGWLRLNVTPAFRHWVTHPNKNFGLVLTIKTADDGKEVPMHASGLTTIMDKEEHQPFLVSFMNTIGTGRANSLNNKPGASGAKSRRRVIRSPDATTGSTTKAPGRGRKKTRKQGSYDFHGALYKDRSCQMGMLYVNFEDLGWKDWVIAPDGFIAYYCHGECSFPLTASMNATNHAIVSTLVHTYYPLEYPRASCAPIKLGSISMLYYDDNSNVTVKKYKDMVIKSCGCK